MAVKYTCTGKYSIDGGPWQERSEEITASHLPTPRRAAYSFKESIALHFTKKDVSRVKVKQFKVKLIEG